MIEKKKEGNNNTFLLGPTLKIREHYVQCMYTLLKPKRPSLP